MTRGYHKVSAVIEKHAVAQSTYWESTLRWSGHLRPILHLLMLYWVIQSPLYTPLYSPPGSIVFWRCQKCYGIRYWITKSILNYQPVVTSEYMVAMLL